MAREKLTRREFMRSTLVATAGLIATACAKTQEVPPEETTAPLAPTATTAAAAPTATTAAAATPTPSTPEQNESPMLAEKVKAGSLPPVNERLPLEPMIVPVVEEIGQFGGTAHTGDPSEAYVVGMDAYHMGMVGQHLLRINPDANGVVPNVLKDWEISDDGKTITAYIRKGIKWSDGQPLTADDMVFRWEKVELNEELTPTISAHFRPGGEVMKLEKVDDYTFTFNFAVPHPTFVLICMGHYTGVKYSRWLVPSEYLKQFHIDFNPQANDLAKEQNYENWYQLFAYEANYDEKVGTPSCDLFEIVSASADLTELERNPNFWMTDPEGNQLPYIDKIISDRLADPKLYDVKITSGEYDFAGRATSIMNYATYEDVSEQANFRILLWSSGKGAEVVYQFNMTFNKDPVLRDIFRDVRWRRAMSLAVNRDEINDVIYFGRATPRQMTMIPQSKYFKPEYEKAYAEYDPDQANALLDEMGLVWDQAHQVRLRPDGEPLKIIWDLHESETPKGPITELMAEYWKAVGVDMEYESISRALLRERYRAGDEPMGLWHGDACTDILFPVSNWFVPYYSESRCLAPLWAQWYQTQGEQGEEPPAEIKQLFDWIDQYRLDMDPELADNLLQNQAENVWALGTVGIAPHPLIVRNNLRNVAEYGIWAWDDLWSVPYFPEQWFLKQA